MQHFRAKATIEVYTYFANPDQLNSGPTIVASCRQTRTAQGRQASWLAHFVDYRNDLPATRYLEYRVCESIRVIDAGNRWNIKRLWCSPYDDRSWTRFVKAQFSVDLCPLANRYTPHDDLLLCV